MSAKLAILMLGLLVAAEACQITFKIKSTTKKPFQIQIYAAALEEKTERITFEKPGERHVTISGDNCNSKPFVVRTWNKDDKGNWVAAKSSKATLDGRGWLRVIVGNDLSPFFMDRNSIVCSGGLCG
uniref:Lysozyme inhibitor n=1 Tax=Panagrellus redivivus TaxID=6233 RepID=A0A7E4UMA3_PANRE